MTHIGKLRTGNEDAIAVDDWIRQESMVSPEFFAVRIDRPRLFVVCDGMGGHEAGEVASRLIAGEVSAHSSSLMEASSIERLLLKLNDEMFDRMEQEPMKWGMGTTIAGIVLWQESIHFFNVGDSRVYRLQNGYLRQLSIDDSAENCAPGNGCGREVSEKRRISGTIRQAIGGAHERTDITPHVGTEAFYDNTRYLICSDGLTDMVDLDHMEACFRDSDDLVVVKHLLQAALDNGGIDNVSIVLVST